MLLAPCLQDFFRPEKEHIVSGEDDVFPPLRGRNQTVEDPIR
jgi:hypothetical protein